MTDQTDAGRGLTLQYVQALAFVVGMGICLLLSVVFTVQSAGRMPPVVPSSGERINPNEAPAPSLMRLPQIGLARARAIVTQRDHVQSQAGRSPSFRTADDLQRIKGIGSAIVAEIRPWLQFDPPAGDANEPSGRVYGHPGEPLGQRMSGFPAAKEKGTFYFSPSGKEK